VFVKDAAAATAAIIVSAAHTAARLVFAGCAQARCALEGGMCVVIGLQSTGEAAADALCLAPGPLPGFVSPAKEMLLRLIAQHFPERVGGDDSGEC